MKETHIINKEEKLLYYGAGEWIDEPDKIYFTYRGYRCAVNRNAESGHLNGYVCIPTTHVNYSQAYGDINVDCHGGLTFGESLNDDYWIGFDCAHFHDYCPSTERFLQTEERIQEIRKRFPNSPLWVKTYKNKDFVIQQCKHIVDQLIAIMGV
jgi:hypothetical protein